MGVILKGNSLEVLEQFSDDSFDAVITDPPYNIGGEGKSGLKWKFSNHVTIKELWDTFSTDEFFNFTLRWLANICRVTKENGNILIFGSFHGIYQTGFILQALLERRIMQDIIFAKLNPQPNISCRLLTQSTEQIIWAVNNTKENAKNWYFDYAAAKNINGNKQLKNVWEGPITPVSDKTFGEHPTQKPLWITERLVTIFTNPTAHVLDPFGGSGTTAVACKKLGRDFTIIEQEQQYVDLIHKRLEHTCNPLMTL